LDEWDQNRVGTKFLSPRKQSVDDKTSLPAKMLAKELIGNWFTSMLVCFG